MRLLDALRGRNQGQSSRHDELHSFAGNMYWGQPAGGWWPDDPNQRIGYDFASLVTEAYRSNAIVYACELTRVALFSEARFQWRRLIQGRPGDLWGNEDLAILESPWQGCHTTGGLLTRMLLDADFAGSAYIARRNERPDRLMRLRPDWVTVVLGSEDEPDEASMAMDSEVLGYLYHHGGVMSGGRTTALLADEVAQFTPPGSHDPLATYRGMSWLTPIIRELQADAAATMHKLMFFEHGAAPQVIVTMGPDVDPDDLDQFSSKMDDEHSGWRNAYKTLYLGGGADVHVVGKDLQQLDFKATQGAGETRIAAASGVSPVVVQLSEGMAGSSLTTGNFNAAKRLVADRTMRPLWREAAGALANIVPPPPGSQLWFDDRDIAFLQEDRKDAAEIQSIQAQAIRQLVDAQFEPDSVTASIAAEDVTLLKHTGRPTVQGQAGPAAQSNGQSDGQLNGQPAKQAIGK